MYTRRAEERELHLEIRVKKIIWSQNLQKKYDVQNTICVKYFVNISLECYGSYKSYTVNNNIRSVLLLL